MEFTSDGVAVLMHDDTVDRTTDFQGPINELSYQQVQRLNAAAKDTHRYVCQPNICLSTSCIAIILTMSRPSYLNQPIESQYCVSNFRDQFPECQVPTLEEAVVLCLNLNLKIYIDVKGNAKQVDLIPCKYHPLLHDLEALIQIQNHQGNMLLSKP